MDPDIEQMAAQHGGYWSEHPNYPSEDWKLLAANNETRRGYWEWVEAQIANANENRGAKPGIQQQMKDNHGNTGNNRRP